MGTVHLPSPLHSYTAGRTQVDVAGGTLLELLDALDRLHPGIRFRVVDETGRIRSTILFHVNGEIVRDLARPVAPDAEVRIVAALSGG